MYKYPNSPLEFWPTWVDMSVPEAASFSPLSLTALSWERLLEQLMGTPAQLSSVVWLAAAVWITAALVGMLFSAGVSIPQAREASTRTARKMKNDFVFKVKPPMGEFWGIISYNLNIVKQFVPKRGR